MLLGCVPLWLAYYDWAVTDIVCLLVNGFANTTIWAMCPAATYFGEKAGNVVVTAAAAYAAFLGLMFGGRACGWIFRARMPHFFSASPRWFSCSTRPIPTPYISDPTLLWCPRRGILVPIPILGRNPVEMSRLARRAGFRDRLTVSGYRPYPPKPYTHHHVQGKRPNCRLDFRRLVDTEWKTR